MARQTLKPLKQTFRQMKNGQWRGYYGPGKDSYSTGETLEECKRNNDVYVKAFDDFRKHVAGMCNPTKCEHCVTHPKTRGAIPLR